MKVYIPRGFQLSSREVTEWIAHSDALTNHFLKSNKICAPRGQVDHYLEHRDNFAVSPFITPMWLRHYQRAEELFLTSDFSRLTRDDVMRYAFFLAAGGTWQQRQIAILKWRYSEADLLRLLREDTAFEPPISIPEYQSSETLVNHLTHLTEFSRFSGLDWSRCNTVIEFGGGYGSMTRLLERLNPSLTHVVIDLPIFCYIQDAYLRSILGDDKVNLCSPNVVDLQPGKINLVPISLRNLDVVRSASLSVDAFVATWSLSEANSYTQFSIAERDYFSAKNIFVGYRHYHVTNPEQPASNNVTLPSRCEIRYHGPTFFCGEEKEQFYLIGVDRAI
jgi:hypothetical protein